MGIAVLCEGEDRLTPKRIRGLMGVPNDESDDSFRPEADALQCLLIHS